MSTSKGFVSLKGRSASREVSVEEKPAPSSLKVKREGSKETKGGRWKPSAGRVRSLSDLSKLSPDHHLTASSVSVGLELDWRKCQLSLFNLLLKVISLSVG